MFEPMKLQRARLLPALLVLCGLIGCGSPAANAAASGSGNAASAAAQTAREHAECKSLGDFYWEIGDARGVLASGQIGDDYSADKPIRIASASKFVWGAYVLERIGKDPTPEQVSYLEMRSGYTKFNPLFCALSKSVDACMQARSNSEHDNSKVGKFSYGGGHDQKLAGLLGMGRMSAREFTQEVRSKLGQDLRFEYASPQPAGGMESSPAEYAKFLRKVIGGQLRLKQYLGYQPVCALPGRCPGAVDSPVKEAWHYSLNHWIEDDPATGDGAFSSPGAMGFYPWISADKTTYGILARNKMGMSSYWDSVQCGREIRRAWTKAK